MSKPHSAISRKKYIYLSPLCQPVEGYCSGPPHQLLGAVQDCHLGLSSRRHLLQGLESELDSYLYLSDVLPQIVKGKELSWNPENPKNLEEGVDWVKNARKHKIYYRSEERKNIFRPF